MASNSRPARKRRFKNIEPNKIEGKRLAVGKPGATIGVMEEVMRFMFLKKSAHACVAASLFMLPLTAWSVDHPVTAETNLTFTPTLVNANVGDTITFTNVGAPAGFHNVSSDGNTLTTPGSIAFYCEIHGAPGAGMSGTINVTLPVELQSFEVD